MKPNNQLHLTNEELNELVGGSWMENGAHRDQSGNGNNTNTIPLCMCIYFNTPSVTNSNSASYCSCYCCPIAV